MTDPEHRRRDELAAALARVRTRITTACTAAGRDPEQVRLLPVTKTFPARDVALLVDLGLFDVAEARDVEAAGKVAEVAALRPAAAVRWHMVGRGRPADAKAPSAYWSRPAWIAIPRVVAAHCQSLRHWRIG
jgi:hypothetical protein